MLKQFETAVRQFQQALAEAGITGDVDVTLLREPMLKLYTEWIEAPVMRFGPHCGFERSVFEFPGAGGMWTIRHKRPEMGDYGKFVSAVGHHRAQAYEQPAAHVLFLEERGRWVKAMEAAFAQSLNAMLCPDASQRTELPLEEALREVHRCLSGIPSGSAIALIESKARDAALEEADKALAADGWGPVSSPRISIRALKSKPTPPTACIVPGCILSSGHEPRSHHKDASGKTWCTDVTDDFIASCKPASDARPKQEDYCPECEKPKTAHGMSCSQDVKPDPQPSRDSGSLPVVQDFGWALAQMRAGKKVRLPQFAKGDFIELQPKCHAIAYFNGALFRGWTTTSEPLLATDWEVVP